MANGDTRTLSLVQDHTKDSLTITFKRNGSYDSEALKQLNWLLRDWRLDEQTRMDPRLFDVVWQVYREVGAQEPIRIVSGYRSPQTNAMLRRRSRVVAEHSQHMRGKAMDFYIPGASMSRVREVGMRLQDGGVGFYPNSYNPFVHLDVGSVRAWPRMSQDQLARLFPDGRTVHVPRDGRPMAGYELAKAEILAKGGTVAGYSTYAEGEEGGSRKSLWAMLFGGGDDEDADFYRQQGRPGNAAARTPRTAVAFADTGNSNDGGARGFFSFGPAEAPAPAPALAPAARGRSAPVTLARAPSPTPAPVRAEAVESPSLLEPAPALSSEGAGSANMRLLVASPVPPRRPGDLETLLADLPLPPVRPVTLASVPSASVTLASVQGSAPIVANDLRGQMRATPTRATAVADERAALRALFAAAVTPTTERGASITASRARPQPLGAASPIGDPSANVRVVFSSAQTAPSPHQFSGPAVAPLPILR